MREFRVTVLDQPGQLALVSAALSQKLVNIRSLASVSAAGPLITFISDDEERARAALLELNLQFEEAEALSTTLSNRPGELANLTERLAEASINLNSIYVLSAHGGEIEIAFTVSNLPKAKKLLGALG